MLQTPINVFHRKADGELGITSVDGCESYEEAIMLVKENVKNMNNKFSGAVLALVKEEKA